ncbi:hypothetical protein [Spongiibacter sp.]|uniref:hypothetical protein n=1 Tax=Spongiibacter sp. TaxID=2024860 RepID=UPI00257B20BC|nr:hypothetical protein [Spongiibacter sp.]|tara:strand:- start:248 stop:556 length:309 start_codon:yes stop_codon:yes gene_type:complete
MQFKNITYALALISLLTGCATTTTGPMPAGKNTYVMSRQEGAFPSGNEPLMAEVLAEASVFCSNQDKEVKLINSNENSGPYILGNYPKATITFSCIEPSGSN